MAKAFLAKVATRAERHLAELAASIDEDLQNLPMTVQLEPSSPQYKNAVQIVKLQVSACCSSLCEVDPAAQQFKRFKLPNLSRLTYRDRQWLCNMA